MMLLLVALSINGRIVVRNRRMETVDEGEVLAKARELSGRILESLGRR